MSTGWMQRAACKGADPELFHPEGQCGSNPYKEARAVCVTCPVRAPCLDAALDAMTSDKYDETSVPWGMHGMWGGTTPLERWRLLGKTWAESA